MKELIINQVLTYAIPIIIGAIVVWLQGRSAREQKWAALMGQVASEACQVAEGSGYKGAGKFSLAMRVFNARMESLGKNVDPDVATQIIEAKHGELTLDKTTAYNEKPNKTSLATADEAMKVKGQE